MSDRKTNEEIKSYVCDAGPESVFYTDGTNVYRADRSNAADVRHGYLIGRWECSVMHWNSYYAKFEKRPEIKR